MNYEELSDFEINKRVAESLGLEIFAECDDWFSVLRYSDVGGGASKFDPCNNPSDAWPLVEQVWKTLMSVTSYDYGVGVGESKTTIWDARMHMHGDNKLRAAMICYLMMQEAK